MFCIIDNIFIIIKCITFWINYISLFCWTHRDNNTIISIQKPTVKFVKKNKRENKTNNVIAFFGLGAIEPRPLTLDKPSGNRCALLSACNNSLHLPRETYFQNRKKSVN